MKKRKVGRPRTLTDYQRKNKAKIYYRKNKEKLKLYQREWLKKQKPDNVPPPPRRDEYNLSDLQHMNVDRLARTVNKILDEEDTAIFSISIERSGL